jgi:hypothetical protein
MKNTIISILVTASAFLVFAGTSQAAVLVCGEVDPITLQEVGVCGNGPIVSQSAMPWATGTGSYSMMVAGASLIDEAGSTEQCPSFYRYFGCVDISKTDYYRSRQIETARQLVRNGTLEQFKPYANYWSKFIK